MADERTVIVDGVRVVGALDESGIQTVETAAIAVDAIEDLMPVAEPPHLIHERLNICITFAGHRHAPRGKNLRYV
jgi:hypothetical protein